MLIRKIPKAPKRSTRFRSQKHCNHVRQHACVVCDDTAGIEVAHVRLGSGAGMGQRPDDHRTVALCKPCHTRQHTIGEQTFWAGRDVEAIIDAFRKSSPAWPQIKADLDAKS